MGKRAVPYSRSELLRRGPQPTCRGRRLEEIAFPLGGIGTGSVSLGGWGQLRDWEVMNRPAKGFVVRQAFSTLRGASAARSAAVPGFRAQVHPGGRGLAGAGPAAGAVWKGRRAW